MTSLVLPSAFEVWLVGKEQNIIDKQLFGKMIKGFRIN